ncbi:GumC family protein [Altericroceibacterium xinjiangense]|uniref:GumC family protein n=1 Tax=Altericroceibacterium xinjiangense TaxID=762261 RepID=UPI000F7DF0DD|nr:lipopolysaccharide biosynthesis protein [Altericroceibacterium xinjiangense]
MNALTDPDSLGIYPREIIAMLRRHWHWVIVPMVLGVLAAGGAVWWQKPVYRSAATLLIDSPQIPTSLVASPLTDIADERIAKIRQQIVSRDSLADLIGRNGLYPVERTNLDFPHVLDLMRDAIGVDLVGADQGQGGGSTIAFTLSFDYDDPLKAQDVTEQLTHLFLVEDKRFRTEQALGTAAFLERRSDELRRQLAVLEDKRRDVEARYAGALPGNVALSAQSSSALRAEISRTDAETQGLLQQNSLLAAQEHELAQAPPAGIDSLRAAQDRLARLSSVYAEDFPELQAARAEVERQRELLRQMPQPRASNLLEGEIAAGRERIQVLASRRAELVRMMTDLDQRAAQAPQAAYELNMIEREYDNLKRQYDSLREKQLDAQVAANLQSEDKGERFSIVDQPSLPLEPLGPKPVVLLIAGLLGGAAMGVFLILAFELLGGTIHGEQTLAGALKVPTFGVVPFARKPGLLSLFRRTGSGTRSHTTLAAGGAIR